MNVVVAFVAERHYGDDEAYYDIDEHKEIPEDGYCGDGKENVEFV